MKGFKNQKAFTLIELLIVIAVIAILGSATVLVLNPTELIAQSRDSQRITDINNLYDGIKLAKLNSGDANFGAANTVYVSIPYDANTNCDYPTTNPLGLPALPSGWSYNCASSANYRKIDGTGWIPVNLSSATSSIPALPIDPVNSTANNFYYSYYAGTGTFELNEKMESAKYGLGGQLDRVSADGGDDFTRYEKGTDITLAPWSFEFNNFTTVALASSNKPGWYLYNGSTVPVLMSDANGAYARYNGYAWQEWGENIPFNPGATYKISCKYRQVADPTTPTVTDKGFYCGYAGVTADGTTFVNPTGVNTHSSQNYHGASFASQAAGSPYVEYVGYTKGYGNPNGSGSPCPSSASPCVMNAATRYIRPLFIINYSGGNGIADIKYIHVEKQ